MFARCTACRWPAFVITDEEAAASVESFNAYAERQGLAQRAALETTRRCHRCGGTTFEATTLTQREEGLTIQPVVSSALTQQPGWERC